MSFESDPDGIIEQQKYQQIADERLQARLDLADRAFGNMLQKLNAMRSIAVKAADVRMSDQERMICQQKMDALQKDIETISDVINQSLDQGRILAQEALEESIAAVDDSYAELLSLLETIGSFEDDGTSALGAVPQAGFKPIQNSKIDDWIKKWSS